jgi:hypothetical protein
VSVLSQLSRDQRDKLRAFQTARQRLDEDPAGRDAQLMSSPGAVDTNQSFLEKLLALTDASGRIHRAPARERPRDFKAEGLAHYNFGDRLSGASQVTPLPTAPLEPYFEPAVWARARTFAQADAMEDASHVMADRLQAKRDDDVRKWASKVAQRDRAVERYRREPPRAPAKLGFGPDGAWEEVRPGARCGVRRSASR